MLRVSAIAFAIVVGGCANSVVDDEGAVMGTAGSGRDRAEKAMLQQCDGGTVLHGIDISYHQGHIDWDRVKQGDVHYAFVRVSDGLAHPDSLFHENWLAVKAAGLPRGVYQFFRSNLDPIAEADLLINKVGQLEPGDLPPVIDVESADGQSPSTIANNVSQWIDHVQSALGVRPIVYAGPYFWRDSVGGADETASPLWIADYGQKTCPRVPPRWTSWAFHQYDDHGVVDGISDNEVDMDRFNGTAADLATLQVGVAPTPPTPTPPTPPTTTSGCASFGAAGAVIDDGDACFTAGGNPQYLHASTQGYGGDAVYTGTTASASVENFAEWTLNPSVDGTYAIDVYVGHAGTSRQASYQVTSADGVKTVTVNQDATSGWTSLGSFHLSPGVAQKVRAGDNTGEAGSLHRNIAFDALRATATTAAPADPCPRVQANAALNIRPQPNTSQAAIGTMNSGDIATHVDTVQGQSVGGTTTWYKVNDGSVTGFVSGAYASCHD